MQMSLKYFISKIDNGEKLEIANGDSGVRSVMKVLERAATKFV